MLSADIPIGAQILQSACTGEMTIEDRLTKAMKAARKPDALWFTTDQDVMFRCAIGAAMLNASDEERDRITRSMGPLKALQAALNGVPVDMAAALSDTEDMIPLLRMWHDSEKSE